MNMKRILIILLVLQSLALQMRAQDIKVTKFERNYTSLIGSTDAVYDNSGEACAVIRFFVRDEDYEIEPNMGVLKKETRTGEIRLWVPIGTKRMTVRHPGAIALNGYDIPVTFEPKATYDAVLEITKPSVVIIPSNNHFYMGVGFNVMSIMGPSITIGGNFNHHIVEADFVYGVGKSDDWFFYSKGESVVASYSYQPIRFSLRYGYELMASDYISITPQIGGAYNVLMGSDTDIKIQNDTYKNANSVSVLGALGIAAIISDQFRILVTPEYDFGVSKTKLCKMLGENDSKIKSWTDGFNLNVSLLVYF